MTRGKMLSDKSLENIFKKVARRVEKNAESLTIIKDLEKFGNCNGIGFEAWLKVEASMALGKSVKALKEKGPDLILNGDYGELKIELKAASDSYPSNSAFNRDCENRRLENRSDIYLGIADGDGTTEKKLKQLTDWKLIGMQTFKDGTKKKDIGKWTIFMARKKK